MTEQTDVTRRTFVKAAAVATLAAGTVTVLPFDAFADAHAGNIFPTANGEIKISPISHASFVMETPAGTIYVDPVGEAAAYEGLPKPDMIFITHHHGDHFKPDTLGAVATDETKMLVNPEVYGMMSDDLKARSEQIANGASTAMGDVAIEAIPAYNTTEERLNFHPKGRDNGYVVTIDGFRVYISGDTEDIPEMRALTDIDLAFVCMNLPFTMDVAAAASAVAEFKPKAVYPYHYRGRDNGTQDPAEFARMVGEASSVKMGSWYG